MISKKNVVIGLSYLGFVFFQPAVFAAESAPKSVFTADKKTPTVLTVPPAPTLNVHGYYLVDVKSGKVLGSQSPDQKMEPASLTKLMTLYLTFEALSANRIHLTDMVPVSESAWRTGGSRMFIKVGDRVPLNDLLNGVIVDSGNDACVALAEFIGGTHEGFVNLMNQQAALLGMKNTHYMDATGLPNPQHYTTPHDLSILTRAIINNYPQYYPLFSQKEFTYNRIRQENRNPLLYRDPFVDGLKTGHTDGAGYCLIASAKKGDMRLVSVLLGSPSVREREQDSEQLLNYGFHFYETHKIFSKNEIIQKVPIYFGRDKFLNVASEEDIYLTIPVGQFSKTQIIKDIASPLKAPIEKNQVVGKITAMLNNQNMLENNSENIVAAEPIQRGNIFKRICDKLKLAWH